MARTKTPTIEQPESRAEPSAWRSKLNCPWLFAIALALLTFAVYWPVAHNEFVNYDDADYVTANRHVLQGLSWSNVAWAFTSGHASNWHPLTWISHMVDCQLFGQNAGAHHLVSVGLHVANSILLFFLVRGITGAHWRSACVAALFALHPLHVESVAWVSERKDVLSTLFFLVTLFAYGKFTQARKSLWLGRDRQLLAWYLLALFSFALGLMSKPMLVTVPFVLLLLDYWPLGRFELLWSSTNLRLLRAICLEKVPFFALAAGSSIITFLVQRNGGAVSTSVKVMERIANGLVSYARYLGKTFWPSDLSVLYPHPGHWPLWAVICSALLILAISSAAVAWARRKPWAFVGWFWFVGCLMPVIGLVQVGLQSMADRYTYIPSIGLSIALVWALAEIAQTLMVPAWLLRALAGITMFCCCGLTLKQVGYWHDSQSLFRRAVQVTSNNYLAYNNLGYYLSGQGKADEAMENYEKSLRINPLYEDALNNMGYAYAGKKQFAVAISYYEDALRVKPGHVEVHNNLGNALSELGRIDEAIEHYRFVLGRKPDHADAHNNLGIALAMKGKLDEAVPHFQAAIHYKPDYGSAHSNLGNAYAVQHRLEEAMWEYQTCLKLKPDDSQAHNNLGNVLAEQGKLPESVEHYQRSLALNKDNPEAHCNLGLALERLGRRAEAVPHYQAALQLKPDYAQARQQLEHPLQPPSR